MAIGAHRNTHIAVRELDPVNAGPVLRELIRSQRRIELFDPAGIGVTRSAKLRNAIPLNRVRDRFRSFVGGLVATDARHPLLRVDIGDKLLRHRLDLRLRRGLRAALRRQSHKCQKYCQNTH